MSTNDAKPSGTEKLSAPKHLPSGSTSSEAGPQVLGALLGSAMDLDDTAGWRRELSVSSRQSNPRKIILPDIERSRDRIAPDLRDAINGVITGKNPWPLFVFGPAGTGKTFAALCLCDAVGGGCIYKTVTELAANVVEAGKGELFDPYNGQRISPERYWQEWRESKLVVLDELGTRQKVSDWNYECAKRGIDNREGKPIILISNVGPDDLEALYDQRIASRCCAGTVVELVGEDRRIAGKVVQSATPCTNPNDPRAFLSDPELRESVKPLTSTEDSDYGVLITGFGPDDLGGRAGDSPA